jgi:anti-sigma B factor antagonist
MEIKTKQLKRVDIVEIHGRVDSNSAAQLEETFKAITEAKRFRILVDMKSLEYMSSRGLRALITTLKEARRWNRGDLRLCNMPPRIKEVFDLAGLTPLFKMYDNPVDAVGSF